MACRESFWVSSYRFLSTMRTQVAIIALLLGGGDSLAQEAHNDQRSESAEAARPEAAAASEPASSEPVDATAGDAVWSEPLGGPTSVGAQLRADSEQRPNGLLAPLRNLNENLRDTTGLSLGIDYTALWQGATASLGEHSAAGGVFRIYGDWTMLGRGTANTGALVFKVENRHRLGTDVSPQALAGELGYAGITATTYSDAGWLLTNFQWKQHLLDGRLAIVAGIVDTTGYVDTYALVSPWTGVTAL